MTKEEISIEHSAMAVVFCKGLILVTQEDVYGHMRISLPKGHVEAGETIAQAAIRECFEETNVVVTNDDILAELDSFEVSFTTPSGKNVLKRITPVLFDAQQPTGEPKPKEERIFKVEFIDVDDFLQVCSYENVKQVVRLALALINKNEERD